MLRLKRGYDLPAQNRVPGPYPVVSSSGITGSHHRAKVPGPGVVTGRYGTIGEVFYITADFWPLNTALYVQDFNGNDPKFCAALLETLSFGSYGGKSAVPGVNRNDLHAIEVARPPIDEQRRIVTTLGALDDKIDSNRRLAKLLEETAAALFRARFVDFVGVEEFEDSELGPIPRGWLSGRLGELVTQRVERCKPSAQTEAEPYVPIDVIEPRSLALTGLKQGAEAQSSLTKFHRGDILFGAMRPYFHKVAIAPCSGTTRTTVFVLRPRAPEDWSFVTLLLHQPETIEFATRGSRGSTIPYAIWDGGLADMPVAIPPTTARAAFDEAVGPLLRQIQNAGFEQRTLTEIRDLLLPKLISGEIRVPDTADPAEVLEPLVA